MAQCFDEDIEAIIDILLTESCYVFSDHRNIETILEMHDSYGLVELEVGDAGPFILWEPRRYGHFSLTVRPTDRLYEHRGLVRLPRRSA